MIRMGSRAVKALYLGSQKVGKVYQGGKLLWEYAKLPKEYQEVEYLCSTGTQYIDTDMYGYNYTRLVVDFMPVTPPSNYNYGQVFGTLTSGGNSLNINWRTGSSGVLRFGTQTTASASYNGSPTGQRTTWELSQDGLVIDGEKSASFDKQTFQTNEKMHLFRVNNSSIVFRDLRIYNAQIWENGVLVRNYVPCYRVLDNVAGMYCTKTNTFYQNAGTGKFSIGSKV